MKIFGDPRSTCTRKVLTTLAELAADYQLVHVDFAKGEHKAPEHFARQPFGQIPALDDDGFVLYESQAICRYLDAKLAGRLVPRDARARALVDQWLSVEQANFSKHAMVFVYHHLLHRTQDAQVLQQAETAFDAALAVLEARLTAAPFLAGESFSLADICYMPYFEYVGMTPASSLVAKRQHVSAWWSRLRERPAWQAVLKLAS
jgi:glutathione S-transferase